MNHPNAKLRIATDLVMDSNSPYDFIPEKYLQPGCILWNYWNQKDCKIEFSPMLSSHPGVDHSTITLVFENIAGIWEIPEEMDTLRVKDTDFILIVKRNYRRESIIW